MMWVLGYIVMGLIVAAINLVVVADTHAFNRTMTKYLLWFWIALWPIVIILWIIFFFLTAVSR